MGVGGWERFRQRSEGVYDERGAQSTRCTSYVVFVGLPVFFGYTTRRTDVCSKVYAATT